MNDKRRLEYIISFRKERLSEILEELSEEEVVADNRSVKSGYSEYSASSDETSDDVCPKYDPSLLRRCPSYQKE
ncbi:17089_t:CDS:1, partial [Acaulospora colombiana]